MKRVKHGAQKREFGETYAALLARFDKLADGICDLVCEKRIADSGVILIVRLCAEKMLEDARRALDELPDPNDLESLCIASRAEALRETLHIVELADKAIRPPASSQEGVSPAEDEETKLPMSAPFDCPLYCLHK